MKSIFMHFKLLVCFVLFIDLKAGSGRMLNYSNLKPVLSVSCGEKQDLNS